MATVFSHALAGSAIVALFPEKYRSPCIYVLGALTAAAPDLDYFGYIQKVPYGSLWGHRGLTHSVLFAVLLALVVATIATMTEGPKIKRAYPSLFVLFFLTTISHACLDAFTNGGLGVAFYAPYDTARYFFPLRPIQVSPMGMGVFSTRGLAVLASEVLWIGLPCSLIFLFRALLYKKTTGNSASIHNVS